MNKYVGNAFSFQMLKGKEGGLSWKEITETKFQEEIADAKSCIGNTDISNILGLDYNREPICLKDRDILYLCQLYGRRLPIGATELPKGCNFNYIKVEVNNNARCI